MIKVLHYAPGFRNGGIESRMLDWYRNTDRTKVQYVLVKLNDMDDTENMHEFKALGGIWYNLPPINAKNILLLTKRIKEIIISENINIVHVHSLSTGVFVLRAAKQLGIKCRIIHSRTTDYLPNEKNILLKKLIRSNTAKFANVYFACSYEAGLWGCGKKYADKVQVIKNGIQSDRFIFKQKIRDAIRKELHIEDKIVIGSIGRLSPQKNIPYLLDVYAALKERNNNYVLVLVGAGHPEIITDHLGVSKLPSDIILVGNKKNVWDYYMAFDVFCSTSHYEGFGTTAIEAQATGIPTILSKGFPEVVAISDFIYRIDTRPEDIVKWCDKIQEVQGKRFPEEGQTAVLTNGYSAELVGKQLQMFYESHS